MSDKNIDLGNAHDYLERVIETLRVQNRPEKDKGPLVAVLQHISQYIQVTRREIASLRNDRASQSLFSSASDELGEVVTEAARATNEIMSAAEAIERLDLKSGDASTALSELVTKIYVACAFQDITGQRIGKVVNTLQSIESKVSALATACGGEVELRSMDDNSAGTGTNAGLLHGPQRAGAAPTQAEIDQMFQDM